MQNNNLWELYFTNREDIRFCGVLYPDEDGNVFTKIRTVKCRNEDNKYVVLRVDDNIESTYALNALAKAGYHNGKWDLKVSSSLYVLAFLEKAIDAKTGQEIEGEEYRDRWRAIELPWSIQRPLVGYVQANEEISFCSSEINDLSPYLEYREVEITRWKDFPYEGGRYETALNVTPDGINPEEEQVPPPPESLKDFAGRMTTVSSVLGEGNSSPTRQRSTRGR